MEFEIQPRTDQLLFEINGFTAEICLSPESRRIAYELRYRAYLDAGAIHPNEEKIVHDEYDDQPQSTIHLIWYEGKPVASVRSCIWSDEYDWLPIEAVSHFRDEVDTSLGIKSRILESSRYVIDPSFQGRKSLFAQLLMFRIHALNSAVHGCTYIVTAVQEKHTPFYQRMLNFDPISEPKQVEWINYDRIVLLSTPRDKSLETALSRGMPAYSKQDVARYASRICEFA